MKREKNINKKKKEKDIDREKKIDIFIFVYLYPSVMFPSYHFLIYFLTSYLETEFF